MIKDAALKVLAHNTAGRSHRKRELRLPYTLPDVFEEITVPTIYPTTQDTYWLTVVYPLILLGGEQRYG